MAGAQITDAEAARMKPRRVIPVLMSERFWVGKEPSIRRAGEIPLCLPPSTATSHLRGDHLAAEWQVGEGASPRLDAENKNRPPATEINRGQRFLRQSGNVHPHLCDRMKRREFIAAGQCGGMASRLTRAAAGDARYRIPEQQVDRCGRAARRLSPRARRLRLRRGTEYRWAQGRYDRLPALAAELVSKPVTILVSTGVTVSARVAKASTQAIPVVFTTADDPVKVGLVD